MAMLLTSQAFAFGQVYTGNDPHISPTASPLKNGISESMANLKRPAKKQIPPELSDAETIRRGVLAGISAHIRKKRSVPAVPVPAHQLR